MVKGRGFHTPCTPVGYLTKVIAVVGFCHGKGWEADDRQGVVGERAGPVSRQGWKPVGRIRRRVRFTTASL
jgi:hypothetical protein